MDVFYAVILPYALAAISILLNIFLYFRVRKKQTAPQRSEDATSLLSKLMGDQRAVVVVDVLDPAEIFVYSPKDRA